MDTQVTTSDEKIRNLLCIFVRKDNQEYDHYETYPPLTCMDEAGLLKRVDDWNNDSSKETTVKVYKDKLLVEMIKDSQTSLSKRRLIDNLRDVCRDIDYSISSLEDWKEEIEELLESAKNNEQSSKITKALNSIKEITTMCIGHNDTTYLRQALNLIASKIDEVLDEQ